MHGQAEVVEPDFGRSIQLVYIRTAHFTIAAVAPIDLPVHAGHPVSAQIDPTYLHFFDGVSERRLAE